MLRWPASEMTKLALLFSSTPFVDVAGIRVMRRHRIPHFNFIPHTGTRTTRSMVPGTVRYRYIRYPGTEETGKRDIFLTTVDEYTSRGYRYVIYLLRVRENKKNEESVRLRQEVKV